MTKHHFCLSRPVLAILILLFAHCAWAENNPKFAWTTQLFLLEQQADSAAGPAMAPDRSIAPAHRSSLIAAPHRVDGTTYISCFIYLQDPTDLSALRALGVRVIKSFKGLNFITADVPVDQLEALAEIDNVTSIKVSPVAEPATAVAREKTNVTPLLANTEMAQQRGLNTTYDGSGVVLGVVDVGIDFRHIAFKNADGTSRIKRAYIYNGNTGRLYTEAEINNPALAPTTDDIHGDHGSHVAAIAGGSSVIVNKIDNSHYDISVTNAHDSATYGGMAPGADLYLAGVKGLTHAELLTALALMAEYADSVGKPLVVNCSWSDRINPRNGKGDLADVVRQYYGDNNPGHILLFASANTAGFHDANGSGGRYVGKKNASRENPLRTIIRRDGAGGDQYPSGNLLSAWSDSALNCKLYVLDNDSGHILWSHTFDQYNDWASIDSLTGYNQDSIIWCYLGYYHIFESFGLLLNLDRPLTTDSAGAYSLAIEVYPAAGTADIDMWAVLQDACLSNYLRHPGPDNPWQDGTNDNSASQPTSIEGLISVGAYCSNHTLHGYDGSTASFGDTEGDICWFSAYVTQEYSTTGEVIPWITAPGFVLISAGNHYHTAQTDADSYYTQPLFLAVNDSLYPYISAQGTSQATPVASGTVALWLQAAGSMGRTLSTSEVKDIMRRTAIHDYYTNDGPNASHFGNGKLDALAGIKLITGIHSVLELPNKAYNDSAIAEHLDSTVNVVMPGRTLYKDDGWDILCLPFSLDSTELEASVLAGCTLMQMDPTRSGISDTTLTVTFEQTHQLVAGYPYLIKWPQAENIRHPYFPGVTISSKQPIPVTAADSSFSFLGTYNQLFFRAYEPTIMLQGTIDSLYIVKYDRTLGAFCTYYRLADNVPVPGRIVCNMLYNDTPTALLGETDDQPEKFFRDGHLYIRRRGLLYDVTGRKVSANRRL